MKVIYAATEEQENQIKELVEKCYKDIFPIYFSDETIQSLERKNVLRFTKGQFQEECTMREAFAVITCLQTIISILETPNHLSKYEMLFKNNRQILNHYGLFFPLDYKHFTKEIPLMNKRFSMYARAANEFLI